MLLGNWKIARRGVCILVRLSSQLNKLDVLRAVNNPKESCQLDRRYKKGDFNKIKSLFASTQGERVARSSKEKRAHIVSKHKDGWDCGECKKGR